MNDDVYYTILLHTDVSDLPSLCSSNKKLHQICHSRTFLINKFNQLPINVRLFITYENLLYLYKSMDLADSVLQYLYHVDATFMCNDVIKQLDLNQQIVNKISDKTSIYKTDQVVIGGLKYDNLSDDYKLSLKILHKVGGKRYGAPSFININDDEAINYLIDLFISYTSFQFVIEDDNEKYGFKTIKIRGLDELKEFLSNNLKG